MTEAGTLLLADRAFVTAAAGCGKTRLIADAVRLDSGRRSLILTHTHAGVHALRKRLRDVGAKTAAYEVETIAGWNLRLVTSFPATSGISTQRPTAEEWQEVYRAAVKLLSIEAIKIALRSSFHAVYVDEYQDCSTRQHETVLQLATVLPTRVLGDPLQGIFDFGGAEQVDWPTHVEQAFSALPQLLIPHRWAKKNPALGAWLGLLREKLVNHEPVDLRLAPQEAVRFVPLPTDPSDRANQQMKICRSVTCSERETLVAVHAWESQCHHIARQTGGKFRSLETMDCDALFEASDNFDRAVDGRSLANAVFTFACLCLTRVKTALENKAERVLENRPQRKGTRKHQEQLDALAGVVKDHSLASARRALLVLARTKGAAPARHELFCEMLDALQEHETGGHSCLRDAAVRARDRTRRTGRPPARYIVGRTVLVKGLEFDHALILDAGALDRKNLYVALTRASRSLTVLATSPVLTPQ